MNKVIVTLEQVQFAKYLGITITDNLDCHLWGMFRKQKPLLMRRNSAFVNLIKHSPKFVLFSRDAIINRFH